eukprot:2247128-Pleurochrysis_carterae.AAC.6
MILHLIDEFFLRAEKKPGAQKKNPCHKSRVISSVYPPLTHQRHVFTVDWRVELAVRFGGESGFDMLRKVLGGGRMVNVEGGRDTVGQVCLCEGLDVFALRQADAIGIGSNVDNQQIGNGALILHVPGLGEILSEGVVEGAIAVVSIQREQVVDVAT